MPLLPFSFCTFAKRMSLWKNIIRKIRMYYPVSDEALEALVCLFKRFVFPEKTTIIHAGKQDRKVYFIEKGITRSFVLHNGKQITTWFSKEGDAACGSWDLYRKQSWFWICRKRWKKTTAYSVSIVQLNELYRSYIDLANWMRVLQQENFLRLQDIHIRRLNWSAKRTLWTFDKRMSRTFPKGELGIYSFFLGYHATIAESNKS